MGLRIADEWSGVRDYIRWFDVMKLMQEIKLIEGCLPSKPYMICQDTETKNRHSVPL
jgi:hypothetical protein